MKYFYMQTPCKHLGMVHSQILKRLDFYVSNSLSIFSGSNTHVKSGG